MRINFIPTTSKIQFPTPCYRPREGGGKGKKEKDTSMDDKIINKVNNYPLELNFTYLQI